MDPVIYPPRFPLIFCPHERPTFPAFSFFLIISGYPLSFRCLASMRRLCKQVSHCLPCHWRIPCPVRSAPSELWPTTIFPSTTCCLTQDRLYVPPLAAHPAFHKIGWVFAEGSVEVVFSFGVGD